MKVETELLGFREVLCPEQIECNSARLEEPGAVKLDEIDAFVMYALYQKDKQTSQESYVNHLFVHTGTINLVSVVSQLLLC